MRVLRILCVAALAAVGGFATSAQTTGLPDASILTIESDSIFAQSAFGQRVARESEAEAAVLAAENRKIEAELTAEEKELTEQRSEMEPDLFRQLADTFDEKVQTFRRTQDTKVRVLNQKEENERRAFWQAAAPVLEQILRDSGATIIIDQRTVFFSDRAIDITSEAIRRIDAAIGEGESQPFPNPQED